MKRAQASLEMVIGLVILLVVAAVVISLVIYYINPKRIPNPQEKLSINEFIQQCEEYCQDTSSNKYCTYYYPGSDWNKNGIKYEIVKVGKYEWPTCEDRVYCFLVVDCDRYGSGLEAIEKCREVLCQTYLDKYDGDEALANESLSSAINFSNKCSLTQAVETGKIRPEDDWYDNVFKSKGCVLG